MIQKKDDVQALRQVKLFSAIPEDVLRALLPPTTVLSFPKDKLVALRGDRCEKLMVLIEGNLSAEIIDPKGKVLKMETLRAPEAIAGVILFAENNLLPVQLTAETDARIMFIPKDIILRLCREHTAFLQHYLRDAGNRITILAEKIRMYQFSTLRQKIAGFLLDLKRKTGMNTLSFPYSQDTMSDIFGVSRPSFSRCLSELVDSGILERDGRNIIISDEEMLSEIIE